MAWPRVIMPSHRELSKLAPVALVIGMAVVVAVGVITFHDRPSILQAAPQPIVMNGVKYIPVQLKPGSPLPAGAVPMVAPTQLAPAPKHAATKPTRPTKSHVVAGGKYGHLAEAILTTHKGPVKVESGNVLRAASPALPQRAAAATSPAEAKMLALQFKDALQDCRTDSGDDCQNLLHLHGKHLRKFEEDQEKADSGLFRIFEDAQKIPDAVGTLPGMVHGGMLAQVSRRTAKKAKLGAFGIPNGGSLPGDDV
mmetsp:Transcript_26381/g.52891  ORF Transcript_26381/g.52891 Transcript_26381/m.52891 type:complete len:253 (+) Transcript_26381:17-775(+)